LLHLYTCGLVIVIILFTLGLTRSKGAILGLLFAAAVFFAFLVFGNRIKSFNKIILIACLLLVIAGGCFIVWYGLTHSQLPGGNSMLVRWQYWNASAKMYADHPFAGVGPGNFKNFYSYYKPPEALEAIADAHNFPLSILTQYGPLGLVGFLAMIFIPLWRAIPSSNIENRESKVDKPSFRTLSATYLIIISIAMLLIRPLFMRETPENAFEVMYVIFNLYIAPIAAFIIGFWLLTAESKTPATSYRLQGQYISCALFCALSGVMLHNLIDYAIFEPPVFTIFCAIIACLIAIDSQQNNRKVFALKTAPAIRILMGITVFAFYGVYLKYALTPAVKSTISIRLAHSAISNGLYEQTHNFLNAATESDRLDPTASYINGRLYLQHHYETGQRQPDFLKKAEKCFLEAISRDHANFKNYEKLSIVYDLLGQYKEAYDWGREATKRYPGSGRIQFQLAQIAEKMNKTDDAIAHYKNAIDIEDSFRRQFRIMYPDREMVSRLGEEKYLFAKQRLKYLTDQPNP